MPINAPIGQTIIFTAVFFDANQAVTVPTSATMLVSYPPSSNSLTVVSCSIDMSPAGEFFVASWDSSVAALGLSSFSAVAPGQITAAPGAAGTLRLIS